MGQKRIWIVYGSRKGGHTYPAEALFNYLKENYQEDAIPAIFNFLDFSSSISYLDRLARWGDLNLPRIWRGGYKSLRNSSPLFLSAFKWIESSLFSWDGLKRKLLRYERPDIIISLQPEINILAPLLKKFFNCPIQTVIIDLAIHGLWVNKALDHYYVFNEGVAQELERYDVPPAKITISGIPLREDFSKVARMERRATKEKLAIAKDLPTVLLLGGLLGQMVDFPAVVESIACAQISGQLLVIFGKNEAGRRRMEGMKERLNLPVYTYGQVANIAEMMWASDLIVSKPGSVTMAEALALGKPMVVITPKAGSAQEFHFAEFLEREGAGKWVAEANKAGEAVKEILATPSLYHKMAERAQRVGRHSLTAKETIVKSIMNLSLSPYPPTAKRPNK